MSREAGLDVVRRWFGEALLASLELPDGWFGGPRRTLHALTNAVEWGDRLILELDNQLVLVITTPTVRVTPENELVADQFAQLVFAWEEYANRRPHAEVYTAGSVRFVAQG